MGEGDASNEGRHIPPSYNWKTLNEWAPFGSTPRTGVAKWVVSIRPPEVAQTDPYLSVEADPIDTIVAQLCASQGGKICKGKNEENDKTQLVVKIFQQP